MAQNYATIRKKFLPSKIRQKLEGKELALVDPKAYKDRCELELGRWRNLRTFTDCVSLGEVAINSLLSGARDVKAVTALGYLMAVQLTAIKMQKGEQSPGDMLSDRMKIADATINMTKEEMKALVYTTHANFQINILNKAADRPDMDKEVITLEHMDNLEVPGIIKRAIIDAKQAEQEDFTPPLPPII